VGGTGGDAAFDCCLGFLFFFKGRLEIRVRLGEGDESMSESKITVFK
jgi:hypothetical protein